MRSTYKGDSDGKKITRVRMWLNAAQIMGVLNVPYAGSLVLTGSGGDIKTLKGFGFKGSTITAVDLDDELTQRCYKEHPDVLAITGDIRDVCQTAKYNSAHLDYCGGLTITNIDILVRTVLSATTLPCVIGVTMLKGREVIKGGSTKSLVPPLSRDRRKQLIKYYKKTGDPMGIQLLKHGEFNPQLCLRRATKRLTHISGARSEFFHKNGKLTGLGTAMIRVDALRHCANTLLRIQGVELIALGVFGYHSQDKRNGGVPFATSTLLAVPAQLSDTYLSVLASHPQLNHLFLLDNMAAKRGHESLRPFALDLLGGFSADEVAKLLGIPKGTLVAWKAHESRGSYPSRNRILGFAGKVRESELGWGRLGLREDAILFEENKYIDMCINGVDTLVERSGGYTIHWSLEESPLSVIDTSGDI